MGSTAIYVHYFFVCCTTIAAPKSLSNNKEFDCSTTQFRRDETLKFISSSSFFGGEPFLPIAIKLMIFNEFEH